MTTDPARTASATGPKSLAEAVLLRVEPLSDRLVRAITEDNPGYRAVNVVPQADLWRSCHDNITRILQLIVRGDDPEAERDGYYDAALETGRRRADQGMPLDDVLRSFRFGDRLIWEALIEKARSAEGVEPTHPPRQARDPWDPAGSRPTSPTSSSSSPPEPTRARGALWRPSRHSRARCCPDMAQSEPGTTQQPLTGYGPDH